MSFEERLISCVRKREPLWNIKSNAYRRQDLKEEKWLEVARELHTSVENCKTRFRSLRDRYGKELKKRGTALRNGVDEEDEWMYFKQLDFLRNYGRKNRSQQYAIVPKSETAEDSWDNQESAIVLSSNVDSMVNPLESTEQPTVQEFHEEMDVIDEKFSHFLENANSFLSTNMKRNAPKSSFLPYLEEKMQLLPQNVRNDLEFEFLARINEELQKDKN
ncbi:uncharacterized protein LOC132258816 [Phlebotomus argentipes]|uniref:uncharacterized protein LOC132258816 n=1 Tax=Phlebotomus argentipes TaxID=94469 RepID=UPI0028931E12|nr:uncharacterized protein LOC132258816 [Phlebotomus argentipes]